MTIFERPQEGAVNQWLSIIAIVIIFVTVAPIGFIYSIAYSRAFLWFGAGVVFTLGFRLVFY
jgi:hypothetical protein